MCVLRFVAHGVACGTYTNDCGSSFLTKYSGRSTAYVSCSLNGYVSGVEIKQNVYPQSGCKGDSMFIFRNTYKTTKKADATDKRMGRGQIVTPSERSV